MSVHLTPNIALGFTRPFRQGVKRTLTIKNNNAAPIVYKVETTAPNLYFLRHYRGRLLPGQYTEIRVSLQAMKDEPPLDAISNDKIIVKSTVIAPEKISLHSDQIWESLDVHTSIVHQQEIKTVYVPSPDQHVEEEGEGAQNRSPVLTQGDSLSTSPTNVSVKDELSTQADSSSTVRSVTDQTGDRAVESEFHLPQRVGDAWIISEPVAPVAPVTPVAPRRRIWTFLQRLIRSGSARRKDEKKLFTPIASIPPIDQKIPPPAYCFIAGEHSHDDKPPHPPSSAQEHSPNVMPTAYPLAQLGHEPQPQPLASEVERELREQLAEAQEQLRTLLASVSEGDAPALRRYNGDLYPVSDDDTKIVSDSQTEVGMGSAL